jgi:hypothetical protein
MPARLGELFRAEILQGNGWTFYKAKRPGDNHLRRTDGLRFMTTRSRQAIRQALHHHSKLKRAPLWS